MPGKGGREDLSLLVAKEKRGLSNAAPQPWSYQRPSADMREQEDNLKHSRLRRSEENRERGGSGHSGRKQGVAKRKGGSDGRAAMSERRE